MSHLECYLPYEWGFLLCGGLWHRWWKLLHNFTTTGTLQHLWPVTNQIWNSLIFQVILLSTSALTVALINSKKNYANLLACEHLSLLWGVVQRANGPIARSWHESNECQKGRPNGPGRLPCFWMMTRDTEADLLIGFKPSIGLKHNNLSIFIELETE